MIYTQHYPIKWHDTDVNRTVRPSQILMYMQETANLQLKKYGCDVDRLRDERGLAFLLSRIAIQTYQPLYAHEEIDVQTWICDGQGLAFNRCFRIFRQGAVVAEAFSVWALMDLQTQKLVRNGAFVYPFSGEEPLTLELPVRFRVPPAAEMEVAGERKIGYADIDYNQHMNNTRYPDMLCDFIPDMLDRRVVGISLSYLHEAAFGKTLTVYRKDNGEEHLFRTADEQGNTCLEARVLTENAAHRQ